MALKRGFAQAGKSVAGFERGLGPETSDVAAAALGAGASAGTVRPFEGPVH